MVIDFSKLAQGTGEAIIEPRKIFTTLPNKDKKFTYLGDVQGQVLEQWFARRTEQDLVIKMNTGSGKTTVGLLAPGLHLVALVSASTRRGAGSGVSTPPVEHLSVLVNHVQLELIGAEPTRIGSRGAW